MKKIKTIGILLICASLISLISISSNASLFVDLPSNLSNEERNAINYVSDRGIMVGSGNYIFSPSSNVSRGMFVHILYKMSPENGNNYSSSFNDVSSSSYYYNAVGWAQSQGIMNGTGNNYFSPDTYVDRQQVSTILYRYATVYTTETTIDYTLSFASDYSNVASYFVNGVNWAYSYGILKLSYLDSGTYIFPSSLVTRKEMALFIYKYGTHVDGIKHGKNRYYFANNSGYFKSAEYDKYLVSSNEYNLLYSYSLSSNQNWNTILQKMNNGWVGSCYGMIISCALDNLGMININGNYCNNVKNIYGIPSLKSLSNAKHQITSNYSSPSESMTRVESIINYYHMLSYFHNLIFTDWIVDNNTYASKIILGQRFSGISLLAYKTSSSSIYHGVIVYGKNMSSVSNQWKYKVYDPNYPSSTSNYLIITLNGSDYSAVIKRGNTTTNLISFYYHKESEIIEEFEDYDIDGVYNYIPNNTNNINLETDDIIWIDGDDNVSICNDRNEEISIYEDQIISDSVINYSEINITENNGYQALLVVPKSANYRLISDSDVNEIIVTNNNGSYELVPTEDGD